MKNRFLLALNALLFAACGSPASAALVDDFDDFGAGSRWSAPIVFQEDTNLAPDALVDYAFDYGSVGIPSAPHSTGGTTIGIAFGSNLTDQTSGDEGESVGVSSVVPMPAGDFRLTADTYAYYPSGSGGGSSEYVTFGVYSDGSSVPLSFGLSKGSGVQWQFSSDLDLFGFQSAPINAQVDLGNWSDLSVPGVPTNGPINQWVTVEISSAAGILSYKINGVEIDSYDNSGAEFSGGSIVIGGGDAYNSVNSGNRQIFDNVNFVPEPASVALLSMSLLGLVASGRKRR